MKKYVLDAGLKLGIIQAFYWLLIYLLGIEYLTNIWVLLISLVISISLFVYFGTRYRKLNEGYLTFKDAFILLFIIFAISGAVTTVFQILLYHVIDPGLPKAMTEKILETTIGYMERFGSSESDIDKMVAEMENKESQYSIKGLLISYLWSFFGGAIISLIVAAIIKKTPPMFEEEASVNE